MPLYYSASNTPSEGGRHISLSLKDLDASVESISVACDENFPANRTPEQRQRGEEGCPDSNLRSSYQAVDQHEQQYQQHVNMLLSKSSGSKYEEMIKKFLISRGNDDTATIGRSLDSSSGPSRGARTPGRSERDRLMEISLVDSSVKLAERAAARQSQSAILRRTQQQAAAAKQQEVMTEVLSAPLERNRYVPPDRSGTPTNLRGRQRAPPRCDNKKPPINSPNKFKKKTTVAINAASSSVESAPRTVAVSVEDFNEWIESNKSWQQKVEEKKLKISMQEKRKEALSIRSPCLSSSVKAHAERSYIRKHSLHKTTLSRSRNHSPSYFSSPTREHSPRANQEVGSRGEQVDSDGKPVMQLQELDESQDNGAPESEDPGEKQQVPPRYEKNIFKRLYDEGKQYNDFNELMDFGRSSGRFISDQMSFSPRINNRSAAMMRKRSTPISNLFRSSSPSSYRMSDITREDRQQHAAQAHLRRVRSMSPAHRRQLARESVTLRGSTLCKSYLNTSGGKMYPERVVESILEDGKVSCVLSSTQQKSAQRASAISQERKRPPSQPDKLSDGGEIFTPRMISKESRRINSRNETSFEDRMLKSMDEYRIKVKVNKEAEHITPGPGQYSNTEEVNRCCPLPRSAAAAEKQSIRSKSPGAKSYSFSRARRALI